MILFNICTATGIVNSVCGTVVKVVIDSKGTLHAMLYLCANSCEQHSMTLTIYIIFVSDLF